MSGTAKWLIVGSVVVMALATLVALGLFAWMVFRTPMMGGLNTGWGMVGGWAAPWRSGAERGMMGSYGYGSGMMGRGNDYGMMGGSGYGMMGGNGYGAFQPGKFAGEPLTLEAVEERIEEYLGGRSDLELAEIMIFDNHAYAEIVETETGIGAMELLVDPLTLAVYPEHGPNMMWNQKYGMHGGGMMGFTRNLGEMTVSEEEAIANAQAYLDRYTPELDADEHAAPFYGYYTIHTLLDGEVVGMLSVNGFTGDVFPHTWHGSLLEMREELHD